ncbi:uncharacterized protein At4g22758 [Malania oleifera]|uniref:uncharacterized protein At4g22758 n=1 Tax=Malania oleifera TaxID=397392 RepID=UPI0025AE89C8|nr:uncharacterized protein At4g22758 [Malania oleifera]
MRNSKNHRRGLEEKNRRGKLAEKASSFHGRSPLTMPAELHRPKTLPDLSSAWRIGGMSLEARPKLTKLLLNVTIQGSVGAVQVVMTPESTVGDLVASAVRQYKKEGRRPILPTAEPSAFDLHYSQFSLESLDREEKLMTLGSRNFFLCRKKAGNAGGHGGTTPPPAASSSSSSCSTQAEKASKVGLSWSKFMDFLL